MNTYTVSEVRSTGTSGALDFKADAERCPRCRRPLFYRVEVGGKVLFVHGDRSFCYAWRDE